MATIVQFGAGNIGRGFMGHLFSQAGFETVFVDVVPEVVAALNERRAYPLRLVGPDRHETVEIAPVRAVDGRDREAVVREVVAADLACTAVGVPALPHVAPNLAAGLQARAAAGRRPLDVLLCENQLHCADLFRGLLSRPPSGADFPVCEPGALPPVGLIETVVARMVPVVPDDERRHNPLLAIAEDYSLLPAAAGAFLGPIPHIPGLHRVEDLFPWVERKLYVHNMGHAAAAYLGYRRGHTLIDRAMADPPVSEVVEAAMGETGTALCRKHRFDPADQRAFAADLLRRFRNPALGDTVARVGRDPLRKLRPEDRLIGALHLCLDQGVEPRAVLTATAAALRYDEDRDLAAVVLQHSLAQNGVDALLERVCGLTPDGDLAGMLRSALERCSVV